MEFNRKKNKTATLRFSNVDLYKKYDQENTLLHITAGRGDLNRVKFLVDLTNLTPDITEILESKNKHGSTPLHYATWFGRLSVVKYLVEQDANLKTKDIYDQTLLHAAAWNGHLNLVKYFLAKGLALEDKDQNGNTPLLSVVRNIPVLEAQNQSGNTHEDRERYLETAKSLISAGADIQAKNNDGDTALLFAAKNKDVALVKFLISIGTDIQAKNNEGDGILLIAAKKGSVKIIDFLVDKKQVDLSAVKDNDDNTLLHLAAVNNHIKLVKYLFSQGLALEAKNSDGDTSLHLAVESANTEIVQYLIEQGANIEAKNTDGKTPLDFAKAEAEFKGHFPDVRQHYSAIVKVLKNKQNSVHQDKFEELADVRDEELFSNANLLDAYPNQKAQRPNKTRYQDKFEEFVDVRDEVLFSNTNLLEANPNQTETQHTKKKRPHSSKPQAILPRKNAFDMQGLNVSLNPWMSPTGFFTSPQTSQAEASPFNQSSISEVDSGVNNSIHGALSLANVILKKPRKKHSTQAIDRERLSQQTQIINAIETFDPNNVTAKPF